MMILAHVDFILLPQCYFLLFILYYFHKSCFKSIFILLFFYDICFKQHLCSQHTFLHISIFLNLVWSQLYISFDLICFGIIYVRNNRFFIFAKRFWIKWSATYINIYMYMWILSLQRTSGTHILYKHRNI